MMSLRKLSRANGRVVLALILAALGMTALIPAGHMIAPSAGHLLTVTLCPSTHALARAVQTKANDRAQMNHAAMDHAAMDHGEIGHGAMDHAAMGHGPPGSDDGDHSSTASTSHCAFSALNFAALTPGKPTLEVRVLTKPIRQVAQLRDFAIIHKNRLRPPERAPPVRA